MKNKAIIGIGLAGLLCSIAGGYYFWLVMRVAAFLAGSQGDNNLTLVGWASFGTLCVGLALLLTSGVSFFVSRRRKSGLSAA